MMLILKTAAVAVYEDRMNPDHYTDGDGVYLTCYGVESGLCPELKTVINGVVCDAWLDASLLKGMEDQTLQYYKDCDKKRAAHASDVAAATRYELQNEMACVSSDSITPEVLLKTIALIQRPDLGSALFYNTKD